MSFSDIILNGHLYSSVALAAAALDYLYESDQNQLDYYITSRKNKNSQFY